jgi:hypothetical protein
MKIHRNYRPAPVVPVSPADFRKQVVEYRGKVSPLGAKLQAAVWER